MSSPAAEKPLSTSAKKKIKDLERIEAEKNAAVAAALKAHGIDLSSSSSSSAKKLTMVEKIAENKRLEAETDRRKAEHARERERLENINPTGSEIASIDGRFAAIELEYNPASDEGRAEFELDSGISAEDIEDVDELYALFTELDEKYTTLAIKYWKLTVAYHQKREEVSSFLTETELRGRAVTLHDSLLTLCICV